MISVISCPSHDHPGRHARGASPGERLRAWPTPAEAQGRRRPSPPRPAGGLPPAPRPATTPAGRHTSPPEVAPPAAGAEEASPSPPPSTASVGPYDLGRVRALLAPGSEGPEEDHALPFDDILNALAAGTLTIHDVLQYQGRMIVGHPDDFASYPTCVECGVFEPFALMSEEACFKSSEGKRQCVFAWGGRHSTTRQHRRHPARAGRPQPPPH